MYRIPFRALWRPLSGKNGRFKDQPAPKTEMTPTVEAAPVTPTVETTPEVAPTPEVDTTLTVETTPASTDEVTVHDELVSSAEPPAVDDPATPQTKWEPTWTKSQLLAVAQGMGLSVTSSNTKAEIVAALTAAG